jgi:CubicO group peptidase (beta-lactamase class C family)
VFVVSLVLVVTLQAAPRIRPDGAAALSAFLRDAVARGEVPAIVAMVVGPDEVLYHEAFGKLNAARNIELPKDAIFNIASMTKPLTSVAVMMLVEEGKLGLDDELVRYLPEWKTRQVLIVDGSTQAYKTRAPKRPITIRQLLTHTSGIGYIFSSPELVLARNMTGVTSELELPLVHDPGERWTYGASTRVLGEVVEKISGQRIDAFLEARIFKPLGMLDTGYAVPSSKYARVVTTHQRTQEGELEEIQLPATLPSAVRGDGGLWSTAADYSRFLRMLLQRGRAGKTRLLGERWIREMTRPQTGQVVVQTQLSTDPLRAKPFPVGAGVDTWGLGFQITGKASTSNGMRRPGSYMWAGIFNTHFWVDPEEEIGVILLMQVLPFYDEPIMNVISRFERLLYQHAR